MTCEAAVDKLVEYARRGIEPETPLRNHVRGCASCHDRYEAERALTGHLSVMRTESADRRSSEHSRAILMRRFDAARPAPSSRAWLWSLPLAAVLIFGMVLVRPVPQRLVLSAPAVVEDPAYIAPADPQEEGFVAVPYVPPLATGELVRVVHTELYPSALASLGVNVDPSWNSEVSADLLMGEDGFPRAVRVSSEF